MMDLARIARRRLVILLIGLAGWVAVVCVRLAAVQVVNSEKLVSLAARQQSSAIKVTGARGAILDRNGRALALSRQVKSFYAVPSEVKDPAAAARAIAKTLGIRRSKLQKRLEDPDHDFVWVARKLGDEEARRIEALKLDGIESMKEARRFYPRGKLAAHVLGYVGLDDVGLGGLEFRYDEDIRGREGRRVMLRDARGVKILQQAGGQPARAGHSAVLTLDAVVQHHVERELDKVFKESRAASAVAVALDPRTGEVLGMASRPTFDPNSYGRYPRTSWRNNAITAAFEPGSTFKVMTFAAAFEEGRLRTDEVIDCGRGGILISRHRFKDHHPYDLLTTTEVLAKSSNVGAIKIGRRLDRSAHYEHLRRFGFGQVTGVDLPGEAEGILRSPASWSGLSQAALSMGQELSVNALQLTSAFAAVANGGVRMKPYLLKRLVSSPGDTVYERQPELDGRVISEATAARLLPMMEEVVRDGTATKAKLAGYTAAGKTGTAQKTGPDGGGYVPGLYTSVFAGFAPSRAPRVVLLVVVDEPRGAYYGGEVAAPVFAAIMQPVLAHLGVPPDNPERAPRLAIRNHFPRAVDREPVSPRQGVAYAAPAPLDATLPETP